MRPVVIGSVVCTVLATLGLDPLLRSLFWESPYGSPSPESEILLGIMIGGPAGAVAGACYSLYLSPLIVKLIRRRHGIVIEELGKDFPKD